MIPVFVEVEKNIKNVVLRNSAYFYEEPILIKHHSIVRINVFQEWCSDFYGRIFLWVK